MSSKRPSLIGLTEDELINKISNLSLLLRIGTALSAEKDVGRLTELILMEAKELCGADGGTLYIREEAALRFEILRSDSLGIALGGTTGKRIELPSIPLVDAAGRPNLANVASAAVNMCRSFNIPDAYDADGFDFSGTKNFDQRNQYRSKSFLTIPLVNSEDFVIGVLQLINAQDELGRVVPFAEEDAAMVEALASQAAMALDNKLLLDGQRKLLEAFIQMIASAIDAKSPYTGAHCERVPILTELLAKSLCEAAEGPYREFSLNEDEWYELKIAAWLHDCGKVTTPVHVMDKATKLETLFDRIELVRVRFEVLLREAELDHRERQRQPGVDSEGAEAKYRREVEGLRDDLAFLEKVNLGGESLSQDDKERIRRISKRRYRQGGELRPLLSEDEVKNLSIARGTLTSEERLIINGHMVHTLSMLQSLPFPRTLRKVPEYAGGHHEKMDGTGYPRGVYAGDMSIPARIMAIADVFEALTAVDRPYKQGKKLSETMAIMGFMKRDNHLDPALFDHFVTSGVYRAYAERFLDPAQIDAVDEAALLAIQPKPYAVPPEKERKERFSRFLPEYAAQLVR